MQAAAQPQKAIPPARDRLQSRLLVAVMVPGLAIFALRIIHTLWIDADPHYLVVSIVISVAFALVAWLARAATPAAAASGGLICFLLTTSATDNPPSLLASGLPPLIALFVLTFIATRFGRRAKEARGLAEARTGRRASQVVANLGIAALCAAFSHNHPFFFPAALAALAEATADTVSSEIGQAFGGVPYMLTTFRRVPPGTDGAISLKGTFAGLLGACITLYAAMPREFARVRIINVLIVITAATAGLFFDSLLGATLERRGYLGNDLVNFTSTAFAALLVYPLILIASHVLPIF